MHPEAIKAMKRKLISILQGAQIEDNGSISTRFLTDKWTELQAFSDEALKTKELNEYLRSIDILLLIWNSVSEVIAKRSANNSNLAGSLSEQLSAQELAEVENKILDELCSIPRAYTGYFRLPNFNRIGITDVTLAPGVRLLDANSKHEYEFLRDTPKEKTTVQSLASLLSHGTVTRPGIGVLRDNHSTSEAYYLAIECKGYYRSDMSTTVAQGLVSRMKHIAMLWQAIDLVSTDNVFLEDAVHSARVVTVVDNKTGQKMEGLPLTIPFARGLARMALRANHLFTRSYRLLTSPMAGAGGQLSIPAEERMERLETAFSPIARCIRKNCSDILTSAEWAFDSSVSESETQAYLFEAIGIEALLGSSENRVSDSLADRLSYLVGRNRSERTTISDKFKKFYQHRSNIVHGNKAHLAEPEVELLMWGRRILMQAIAKEVNALED